MRELDGHNIAAPDLKAFFRDVAPRAVEIARARASSIPTVGVVTHAGFLKRNGIVRGHSACNAEAFEEVYRVAEGGKWYRTARPPRKTAASCPRVEFDAVDVDACEDPAAIRAALA